MKYIFESNFINHVLLRVYRVEELITQITDSQNLQDVPSSHNVL